MVGFGPLLNATGYIEETQRIATLSGNTYCVQDVVLVMKNPPREYVKRGWAIKS